MPQRKYVSDSLKQRIIELRKQKLKREFIKERLGVSDWIITKTVQEYKQGEKEWTKNNC